MRAANTTRWLARLLILLVLALGLAPGMAQTAYAATDAYTNLVPTSADSRDAIAGKQVTFNGFKWNIIEDNSTGEQSGYVTLLAANKAFGFSPWGFEGATDYLTESQIKGLLQSKVDGEFKRYAQAIKDTPYGKLYLLSKDEASRLPGNVRKIDFKPSFAVLPEDRLGRWWLRSGDTSHKTVDYVAGYSGEINREEQGGAEKLITAKTNIGVRPALQLDLRYFLFDPDTKTFNPKPLYDHMISSNESADELQSKRVTFNGREWYLIDEKGVTDFRHGTVTLLAADGSFGSSAFGTTNNYGSSTVKASLDALTTGDGEFAKAAEEAIKDTGNGKLYLLSKEEAEALPENVRKSGAQAQWWLRSGGAGGNAAYMEAGSGSVNSNGSVGSSYGVRPAVQLDLSKAMYAPSAKAFALTTYTDLVPTSNDNDEALASKKVYFHKRPWYVIEDKSADPDQPRVKLLAADTSFGYSRFSDPNKYYADSDVKRYLNTLTAEGGAFGDVADVIIGGFDLLSSSEANALPVQVRKLYFPESNYGGGAYWTKSFGSMPTWYSAIVIVNGYDGAIGNALPDLCNFGVRPCITLDLTGVTLNPDTRTFTEHRHDFAYSSDGGTITATCRNEDGICKLPNCTATLTLVAPTLKTYGQTGEGISAEATVIDEKGIRGKAAIEYYKVINQDGGQLSDRLPSAPIDAGMYLATIRIDPDNEASEAYVVYTIEKADSPVTVQDTADAVVGGKTVDLARNVTLGGATGAVSYRIDGDSLGCTISDEGVLTSGDIEGTVKVTVAVAAEDNYKAFEGTTISVTIANKDKQTIEAEDVEVTFGDTDKAVSARVTSPAQGSGAISYAVKPGSEDYLDVDATSGALTIKKVPADGKAYVTVTAAETETSEQATKDVAVTIAKANAQLPMVRANGWTADGTERQLVTVDGLELAGGTTLFALGSNASNGPEDSAYGESIPTATDAGTYYVWYKVLADENHNDAAPACVTVSVVAPVGTGVDDLIYTISSTEEWNKFAALVGQGTTFSGVVVQLTDDIEVSTMVGTDTSRFQGTFDGDGHTITFNCTTGESFAAPFRVVEGATFRNLTVVGTIATSNNQAAGFVAHSYGNTSFTSCRSKVTIDSSRDGNGTHGGFVATADGGVSFVDCLFDGQIKGDQTTSCGGFVGWPYANRVSFANCLNAGEFATKQEGGSFTDCGTFWRSENDNNITVVNSYYQAAYGTTQGTQTDKAGEELKAMLGDGWTVNADCKAGVIPKPVTMTIAGEGTNESPYLISNTDEWNAFARCVDDGISFDGKVLRLADDITVEMMVGTEDHRFKGTFAGAGHTLTFNCTTGDGCAAPFLVVDGAKFTNLTVAGTITTSNNEAAGFVAHSYGNTSFTSCRSKVTIDSSREGNGTHGGFVATAYGRVSFVDCLFDGQIKGGSTNGCGGFVGWSEANRLFLGNCLNAGDFATEQESGTFKDCGTFSRTSDANSIITDNSYYKAAYGTEQGAQTNETGEALRAMLGDGWTVNADGKAGVVPGSCVEPAELFVANYDTVRFAGIDWLVLDAVRTNGYLTKEALNAGGQTASGMLLLAKGSRGTTSYDNSENWLADFYANKINDNAKTAVLGVAAGDGLDGTGSDNADKAFLLSPSEYDKYNGSSTANKMIPGAGQWWLRPGEYYVDNNGGRNNNNTTTTSLNARPALNLKHDHIIIFDNTSPKTIKSFEEAVADDKAELQKAIDKAEATRDYVAKGYTNESKQAVTDAVTAGNKCITTNHQPSTVAETKAILAEIAQKKADVQNAESSLTTAAYDVPATSYTVRVGDEIRATGVDLAESAAAGKAYGGTPMFRVLKVEDGRMLLMSEYLWAGGKGSNSFGRVAFGSGNTWQGSAAQDWAAAFGEDVLGQIKGLAVSNVPGSVSDGAYPVPEGQASGGAFETAKSDGILTTQDKVFFLSGEEALEFMNQKGERVAKLYDEGGVDDASYWWLRSAVRDGSEVGYMAADGSAATRAPSQGGYLRPAFWATMPDIDPATMSRSIEDVEGTRRVVYTITLHKHEWDEPTYEWATDNKSVTAKRVCAADATHVETETAEATGKVTKQPTCKAKGETTYTSAAFKNEAFAVQTKTVEDVDIVGHDWSVFAAQGATVTAKCGMCSEAGPTLAIAAPTLKTYGQEGEGVSAQAAITTTGDADIQGDAKVAYYKADASGEKTGDALEGAPTGAGSYRAEITLGKGENAATAFVVYAIAKADPTAVAPTGLKATYGQTLADVALGNPDGNTPGTWTWDGDPAATAVGPAGTSTFKASFAPEDAANYDAVAGVDVTIAVGKADPVAQAPTGLKATYGQTLADVALGNPDGNTAGTWTWVDDSTTSVGNAGENAFKASFAPEDAANYDAVAGVDVTIAVGKARPTAAAPAATATFGQALSAVALENPEGNTAGTWAWKDAGQTVGNAGENTFKATFTPDDAANYDAVDDVDVTVSVVKAPVAVPEIPSKEYTGASQAANVPTSELYAVEKNDGGTDVGEYDVVLTLSDVDNRKWEGTDEANVTLKFRITPAAAPAVAAPAPAAVAYDPNKTLEDVALPEGWEWADRTAVPAVGNAGYDAMLPVDDKNYDYAGVEGYDAATHKVTRTVVLPVEKAVVDAPAIAAKVHNGHAQVADVPESAYYAVTLNGGGTDVGEYDVVLTLTDTANCKWADTDNASIVLKFQIVPEKTNAVTVGIEGWTYGDGPNAPSATATYGQDAVAFGYASSEAGPFSPEVPTDAGTWYVRARVEAGVDAGGEGYPAGEATARFEIARAASAPARVLAGGRAYDGTERPLVDVDASALSGGEMRYALGGSATAAPADGEFGEGVPSAIDAGTYYVWCRVEPDANHVGFGPMCVVVTVAKGDWAVAAPEPADPAYSGRPQTLVRAGSADGGAMSYSLDGRTWSGDVPSATGAGSYTVWYRVDGDANHDGYGPARVAATIAKAPCSVTAPTATNPTYDGRPQALVRAGSAEGGAMSYSLDGSTWSGEVPSATEAGSYTVWYRVAGDANHDDAAPRGVAAAIMRKGEPKPEPTPEPTPKPEPTPEPTPTPTPQPEPTPTPQPEPKPEPGRVEMLRLYNPYTGEHFYTASAGERDALSSVGWAYEGVGWVAPTEGAPVFRLYNPNAGDHHYTTSAEERDYLVSAGWSDEGVGWHSAEGGVPIWRQYNAYAATGSHNYTASGEERDMLVSAGWRHEGVGWYGLA